jgi:hypothetical protein
MHTRSGLGDPGSKRAENYSDTKRPEEEGPSLAT